jgi:hypothetical protein
MPMKAFSVLTRMVLPALVVIAVASVWISSELEELVRTAKQDVELDTGRQAVVAGTSLSFTYRFWVAFSFTDRLEPNTAFWRLKPYRHIEYQK